MARNKNSSTSKQKTWVRVLCIVLCVLLAGGTLVSVLIGLL